VLPSVSSSCSPGRLSRCSSMTVLSSWFARRHRPDGEGTVRRSLDLIYHIGLAGSVPRRTAARTHGIADPQLRVPGHDDIDHLGLTGNVAEVTASLR